MNHADETPNNWDQICNYVVVGSVLLLTVLVSVGIALYVYTTAVSCI